MFLDNNDAKSLNFTSQKFARHLQSMFHLYAKSMRIIMTSPKLLAGIILPIMGVAFVGLVATILIFALALKPQAEAFIKIFPVSSGFEALAWIIGVILCLMESVIAIFLVQLLGLQKSSERVFHYVYKQEHQGEAVINHETYLQSLAPVTSWRFLKPSLIFILTMPINAIPILGQVIFIFLNGYFQGPAMHGPYFKLRGWSSEDTDKHIAHYRSRYWSFGVFMTMMELIPILNLLNNFIGAGAAALMAVEMETEIAAHPPNTE